MMLQFPFFRNMTSKKLSNLRQSVQCSSQLIYNVFEDDVTVSFLLQHDVKETKECYTISAIFSVQVRNS